MSFPYKESLVYFEKLAVRQVSMYNDSADVGVRVTEEELSVAREHLRTLKKFYGGKVWTLETSFKQAAVNNIVIPIEQVDRDTYNCTVLSVNCSMFSDFKGKTYALNRNPKPKGVWLGISINSKTVLEADIAVFRRA